MVFTRENLRILNRIFEVWAKLATYGLVKSSPSPGSGVGILDLYENSLSVLLTLLLGGDPKSPVPLQGTRLEAALSDWLLHQLCRDLTAAWKPIFPFALNFASRESYTNILTLYPPQEMAAVAVCDVTFEGGEIFFGFCFPYSTLKRVRKFLTEESWYKASIPERLTNISVETVVGVDLPPLTWKELQTLRVGDTLKLPQDYSYLLWSGENSATPLAEVRLDGPASPLPPEFYQTLKGPQVVQSLEAEHPLVAAQILKRLNETQAVKVLSVLSAERSAELKERLNLLGPVAPAVWLIVEKMLFPKS